MVRVEGELLLGALDCAFNEAKIRCDAPLWRQDILEEVVKVRVRVVGLGS